MEERFFEAVSDEQQEKNRKLLDKLAAAAEPQDKTDPAARTLAARAGFPESRRDRRARERAEAKAERRAKAKAGA